MRLKNVKGNTMEITNIIELESYFEIVSYSTPTSRTQKLKLMREGGHFTYSSTLLTCSSRRAQMWNRSRLQFILVNRACHDSNSRPLTLTPC
jgi:hypothetical protein